MKFLGWMYELPISYWIRESTWGHPIMLCFHAIGMAVVVGIVVMLAIRVATGWPKGLTAGSFEPLLRLAQIGFVMNFLSGLILFMANAPSLTLNWTFQIKIVLIILGAVLVWWQSRVLIGTPEKPGSEAVISVPTRIIAALTIVCWIAAVVAGRYIAYTLQKVFL